MLRTEKSILEVMYLRRINSFITKRSKHTLTGDDYQYLHKSAIPTYHFQKSLRRLPIPKLPDTVNRYLASAKAVLSDSDYTRTEAAIRDFEKNQGPALQSALLDYDKHHKDTSYISEPWFDMYLRSRVPVPVNFNPFLMYAPDPDSRFMHQLSRATNFAVSYARIRKSLDSNLLAPEVFHMNPKKSDTAMFRKVCKSLPASLSWFGAVAFKAFPLDMSQYKSLFNGNRIPKREKDVLYHDGTQKHFLAIHKGRMYSVRIFEDNGDIIPAEQVHASLAHILNKSEALEANKCVGSLTSLDRDSFADARVELENAGNGEQLRLIDGALFALCLDDLKVGLEDPKRVVQSLLIGDEAKNRWFDKCFQLIVDGNGEATINFEHSWGDGVAVLRLMEESFRDINKHHFVGPDDVPASPNTANVSEIEFKLTDSLRATIESAQKSHVESNKGLDFSTMQYRGMTRDTIKKTKISPDSVMQLAIQMAFYSMYKEFVPTYESCSTAAFLKGRTECMRSATSATRKATMSILEGSQDMELLRECSNVHGQLVKEASMGQAFDRHLLGLKITAGRQGTQLPEFFQDAGYARMGEFVLSTSTLSTETIVFGGFGPVVADGFGIGYNVDKNMLGAVISSHTAHRDAAAFGEALYKNLDILKGIMEK